MHTVKKISNSRNMHATYESNASLSKAIYLLCNSFYLYFFMSFHEHRLEFVMEFCLCCHGFLPLLSWSLSFALHHNSLAEPLYVYSNINKPTSIINICYEHLSHQQVLHLLLSHHIFVASLCCCFSFPITSLLLLCVVVAPFPSITIMPSISPFGTNGKTLLLPFFFKKILLSSAFLPLWHQPQGVLRPNTMLFKWNDILCLTSQIELCKSSNFHLW